MVAGYSSPPQTAGLNGIYAPSGAEIIVVAAEKQSLSISLGRRIDVRINAVIMDADEDSAVHVRGWFDSSVGENYPIGKAGQNGSLIQEAWSELHGTAEQFGGQISYAW